MTSEEEILDALARDEINFTQYYDLVELFIEKVSVFGPNLERLLVIPGIDRRWIDALHEAVAHAGPYGTEEQLIRYFPYDFERIAAFIIFEKPTKRDWSAGAKLYTHGRYIAEDPYYPKSYITLDAKHSGLGADIRLHEDCDGTRVRRRSLSGKLFGGDFILGSFRKGLGPGLIMGKAFYIPGAERENSTAESFINPQDNMFNGFRYDRGFGKIGIGMLASRIVYDSVAVDAMGAMLSWHPAGNLSFGGVFGYGDARSRPENSTFRQSTGSLFGIAELDGGEFFAEIGLIDNAQTGFMAGMTRKISESRTLAEVWSYSKSFNPMNAKGLSDYRQTYIELDGSGVTQRSREAGESGFEVKVTTPLPGDIFFDFEQSGWRTPAIGDWGLSSETALNYRGRDGRRIRGGFSWEKRYTGDSFRLKETLRLRMNWPLIRDMSIGAYFRLRWTTTESERFRSLSVYPEISCDRFTPMTLKLRIKKYKSRMADDDNGYWELRLRDELRSGPILWIAELRHAAYDDIDKESLTEFRVTAAYYWR